MCLQPSLNPFESAECVADSSRRFRRETGRNLASIVEVAVVAPDSVELVVTEAHPPAAKVAN